MHQEEDLPLLLRKSDLIGEPAVTPEQAAANKAAKTGPKRPRNGRKPIVRVSNATLWRWVREGKFPAPFTIGDRTTVWSRDSVLAWLKSRTG